MSPCGKAQLMLPSEVNGLLLISDGVYLFLKPQCAAVALQSLSWRNGVSGVTATA